MKHLKHIFESHPYGKYKEPIRYYPKDYAILPEEIIHELRDICLELTDDGFHVQVENLEINFKHTIIYITEKKQFTFDKIKEVIERIADYMNSMGYKCIYDNYTNLDEVKGLWGEYCDYLYITFIQKNN